MKGSLSKIVLSKYPNAVFIETGSFRGAGIDTAIDCGFEEIHSIELHKPFYDYCTDKFKSNNSVCLHLGDSAKDLWGIIKEIDRPITFWLDGHIEVGVPFGVKPIPILEELKQIGKHKIKSHTILVDDRRVMGTDVWFGITEEQIIEAIMKVNKNYVILYEDTCNAPKDIIVAWSE